MIFSRIKSHSKSENSSSSKIRSSCFSSERLAAHFSGNKRRRLRRLNSKLKAKLGHLFRRKANDATDDITIIYYSQPEVSRMDVTKEAPRDVDMEEALRTIKTFLQNADYYEIQAALEKAVRAAAAAADPEPESEPEPVVDRTIAALTVCCSLDELIHIYRLKAINFSKESPTSLYYELRHTNPSESSAVTPQPDVHVQTHAGFADQVHGNLHLEHSAESDGDSTIEGAAHPTSGQPPRPLKSALRRPNSSGSPHVQKHVTFADQVYGRMHFKGPGYSVQPLATGGPSPPVANQ